MQRPHRSLGRNRLIGLGVLVVLIVAMVLNTKFLTPEELAAAGPKRFDPKQTAADLFAKAKTDLPGQAAELGEVLPAVQSDPKAAAEKYQAISPAEKTYVFPVKTTATVSQASAASLRLTVPGVPGETPVLVPLSTAVNGTVLRDAMGFKFADAPGQTEYQYVGDELKKLIQAEIAGNLDSPASLEGKKVSVVGVISVLHTGGPPPKAKPVNIQPLTIEATS
jgi:predicted lipoprotein